MQAERAARLGKEQHDFHSKLKADTKNFTALQKQPAKSNQVLIPPLSRLLFGLQFSAAAWCAVLQQPACSARGLTQAWVDSRLAVHDSQTVRDSGGQDDNLHPQRPPTHLLRAHNATSARHHNSTPGLLLPPRQRFGTIQRLDDCMNNTKQPRWSCHPCSITV